MDTVLEARQETEKAIRKVTASNKEWIESVVAIAEPFVSSRVDFVAEDLLEHLDTEHSIPEPTDRRAMGAVMRALAKRGLIEATTQFRLRTKKNHHCGLGRVWKVL